MPVVGAVIRRGQVAAVVADGRPSTDLARGRERATVAAPPRAGVGVGATPVVAGRADEEAVRARAETVGQRRRPRTL